MSAAFFDLPDEFRHPAKSRYLIQPIPYEGTVCFMDGTSRGPAAILAVSDQMEHFDEELLTDITHFGVATLPEIPSAESPEAEFERIYTAVRERELFQQGRFPIFLGGEHSVTPPIVKALTGIHENVSVLQFDAHADLRQSYTGGRFSHASAMRRVLDHTPHLAQVGIRSFSEEEYQECPERIHRVITPPMLAQDFTHCVDRILHDLTEKVYITIDIDAFDPSFAPATGTPEPGGLTWQQVTGILRKICEAKVVLGADVVEVAPFGGVNVITEFLAARLVAKLIAYTLPKKHI